MFDNPILDHERIYIQDDLSYNFSNHRDAKEIIPGDELGGRLWSLISKMLHQITSLILSYFIRPRHIELPEHEEAPLNEESIASEDSILKYLERKLNYIIIPSLMTIIS